MIDRFHLAVKVYTRSGQVDHVDALPVQRPGCDQVCIQVACRDEVRNERSVKRPRRGERAVNAIG